jgi:proteasome lid subunit RPN8/RPN11
LYAQSGFRELPVDAFIAGSLGYGDEVWYSFVSDQTSFLIIETIGETDTYMEVYDANNNLLMEDDDAGEGTNARVDIYVRSGSTYYIKVRGYDDGIAGQYHIHASYRPIPSATDLRFGTPIAGRIAAGEDYWFSVRSNRDGIIIVETTGNTDTYIDVYNSAYSFMLADDDSGDGKNARVEFNANANQTYFVKLRAYSRSGSGSYRIHSYFQERIQETAPVFELVIPLEEPLPPDTDRNTERSRAVSFTEAEEKTVYLYGGLNESRWYAFEVTDEEVDLVIYTKGIMNSFLYLYDSFGNLITMDDDSGEDHNALISGIFEAGIYYIEVMEYFNRAGRLTLHIELNR